MSVAASEVGALRTSLHRQAVTAPLHEVASSLEVVLGQSLTAYIAGVREGKTVHRWATGAITSTRDAAAEQRMRAAYQVSRTLLLHDAPSTVRAWFMGMNPELEDISPAEVIRQGRFKDALDAALTFVAYG